MVHASLAAVVVEYLEIKAKGRRAPTYTVPGPAGHVEFSGSDDRACLSVIAGGGLSMQVLALGSRERTVEVWEAVNAAGTLWPARPHRFVLGGLDRTFRPVGGELVLGVVEAEAALTILLCQLTGRLSVVLYESGVPALLHAAAPVDGLGVVDVDLHRSVALRRRAWSTTVPCDLELSATIARAIRDLCARSIEAGIHQRRGMGHVGAFGELLIALAGMGCGDLSGNRKELCAQINGYFPGRTVVSPAKLSEVLKLLHRTGTCLIERPSRGWVIRLGALRQPSNPLLRKLLTECPPASPLTLPSLPAVDELRVRPRAKVVATPPAESDLAQLRERLANAALKL